jgi:hypothetical protein
MNALNNARALSAARATNAHNAELRALALAGMWELCPHTANFDIADCALASDDMTAGRARASENAWRNQW